MIHFLEMLSIFYIYKIPKGYKLLIKEHNQKRYTESVNSEIFCHIKACR